MHNFFFVSICETIFSNVHVFNITNVFVHILKLRIMETQLKHFKQYFAKL